jgi:Mlc titration factor MtfA (ptsG expression regulator)
MFEALARWRRRRLLEKYAFPDKDWDEALAPFRFFDRLSGEERRRLRELVSLFCAEKEFAGAGGFEVTLRVQLTIAAQACLPILNLDLAFYRDWRSIVVYGGEALKVRREVTDEAGVVHEYEDEIVGEAGVGGPLVLAWQSVMEELPGEEPVCNAVIHEFAHRVDGLSGETNGAPPLTRKFHAGMTRAGWQATMRHAYDEFCAEVGRWEARGEREHEMPLIDPYAAEDAGEFFAVVSEVFFVRPAELHGRFPELYKLLARYYRQEPLGSEGQGA